MTEWAHTQSLIIHIDLYSSYVFTFIKNGDRGVQSDPIIGLHLQKEFHSWEQSSNTCVLLCSEIAHLGLNLIQPFPLHLQLLGQPSDQVLSRATSVEGSLLPGASALPLGILETELRPHPHEQQDRGAWSLKLWITALFWPSHLMFLRERNLVCGLIPHRFISWSHHLVQCWSAGGTYSL